MQAASASDLLGFATNGSRTHTSSKDGLVTENAFSRRSRFPETGILISCALQVGFLMGNLFQAIFKGSQSRVFGGLTPRKLINEGVELGLATDKFFAERAAGRLTWRQVFFHRDPPPKWVCMLLARYPFQVGSGILFFGTCPSNEWRGHLESKAGPSHTFSLGKHKRKIESQVLPIPAAETFFLQPRSTWEVLVEDPGCLLGSPALDSLWIATRALWLRRQRPIWETQGPVGRVQWDLCLGLALEIRMFCTSHH